MHCDVAPSFSERVGGAPLARPRDASCRGRNSSTNPTGRDFSASAAFFLTHSSLNCGGSSCNAHCSISAQIWATASMCYASHGSYSARYSATQFVPTRMAADSCVSSATGGREPENSEFDASMRSPIPHFFAIPNIWPAMPTLFEHWPIFLSPQLASSTWPSVCLNEACPCSQKPAPEASLQVSRAG